jgi:two-component system, NtrC family, response regulator GlrR
MSAIVISVHNPTECQRYADLIQHLGQEVITCTEGSNATLKACHDHSANLCIIDMMQPGETGIEIMKAIQTSDMQIDVLLISRINTRTILDRAFRLGAKDILTKPFHDHEFVSTVIHCLENATGA